MYTRGAKEGRWAAGAVALLLGLGACGESSLSTDFATSSAENPDADVIEVSPDDTALGADTDTGNDTDIGNDTDTGITVTPEHAEAIAFEANITIDDLPVGWVECCPPIFASPDLLAYNTCGDPSVPPSLGGFVREFALDVDERGVEHGHLVVQVFVSADADDAAAKLACRSGERYRDERVSAAEEDVVAKSLVPVSDVSSTYEQIVLDVADHATVDRVTTTLEVSGSGTAWTQQDSIRFRVGAITYRILIFRYDRPLSTAELEDWVRLLLDRTPAEAERIGDG